MSRLVKSGKKTLSVRMATLDIVSGLKPKDWYGEVSRLHAFVRDEIRYVKDIRGVETVHTPEKMLEIRQGDCDDKSILLASMLESIGHPTRFVAVAFPGRGFSHVLVETKVGNKWISAETTEPWALGRGPVGVNKRMVVKN